MACGCCRAGSTLRPCMPATRSRCSSATWHWAPRQVARRGPRWRARRLAGNARRSAASSSERTRAIQVGGGIRTRVVGQDLLALGVRGSLSQHRRDTARRSGQLARRIRRGAMVLAFAVRLDEGVRRASPRTAGKRQTQTSLWTPSSATAGPACTTCCAQTWPRERDVRPNVALYAECVRRTRASPGRPREVLVWPTSLHTLGATGRRRDQRPRPLLRGPSQRRGARAILARRIIPCLDVRDGQVVKGVRSATTASWVTILELATAMVPRGARRHSCLRHHGEPRGPLRRPQRIGRIAASSAFPSALRAASQRADAEQCHAGAEKISVNSPALACTLPADRRSARRLVRSAVVVG